MHEFNITIKLENKDYCSGCPCLRQYDVTNHSETITLTDCNLFGVNQDKQNGNLIRLPYCKQNDDKMQEEVRAQKYINIKTKEAFEPFDETTYSFRFQITENEENDWIAKSKCIPLKPENEVNNDK